MSQAPSRCIAAAGAASRVIELGARRP